MRVLVTGSAGHLGEALMRRLPGMGHEVCGLDRIDGPFVDVVASIEDRAAVEAAMVGIDGVVHAATLHKPHIATHPAARFVETNVAGTLTWPEAAVAAGVGSFVFTSSTTAFGRSLVDERGSAAAWIDETVGSRPKNIYGTTKVAAEDFCELAHHERGLSVVVLRASRFFPEADDVPERAAAFDDLNLNVLELLYRRVDLEDLVAAHAAALERAPSLGFARYVVSASTPFRREDRADLVRDPAAVIARRCAPAAAEFFGARGWRFLDAIDRVYDNALAVRDLGWQPRFTFDEAVARLARGEYPLSDLAREVGSKGYGGAKDHGSVGS